MSIIEVLVALSMAGVLAAVIASIMQQMHQTQKQANIINTLENMRGTIQKLLQDGTAWNQTVADPAPDGVPGSTPNGSDAIVKAIPALNCLALRDGTCPNIVPGAQPNPAPNTYFDAAPFIDLPILADQVGNRYLQTNVGTEGFTAAGAQCNTFTMAGNDQCPIRWEIRLMYSCPGAGPPATCVSPAVRAIAFMYFRPDPASPLKTIVNESKYRVDITRGASGDNKSEVFEATMVGNAAGTGGGACSPAAWAQIGLNALVNKDGSTNATLAGGKVTITAGTYSCTATASCFACGALRVRLMNETAGSQLSMSPGNLAPRWILAQDITPQTTFIANGPAVLRLDQFCQNHPFDAVGNQYGMGMSLPDYDPANPTKYASLTCTKIF